MAQQKLPLKDILAAVDMGAKTVWDELDDEERKQVSFYLLNRYVSSQKGSRDSQELAVFKTNEYYNKNFFTLQKHKKLLWQLLCLSGNTKNIQYHEWIGHKRKGGSNSKSVKFIEKKYNLIHKVLKILKMKFYNYLQCQIHYYYINQLPILSPTG